MSRDFGKGIVALVFACCASTALAVPVKYDFTTAPATYIRLPDGSLVPLPEKPELASLSGFAVTGSFYYDAEAPVSFTLPSGFNNTGSTVHDGGLTNLSGSINGLTFSDGFGSAHVGNDTFGPDLPPPPRVDILNLTGYSVSALADFVGGSVNGLQLINVRMFWIEGQTVPSLVPDFLSAQALPGDLPTFAGRLALEFGTLGAPATNTLFRDNLIVTRAPTAVSEPETLVLALAGLVAFAAHRRRARGASI